MWRWGNVDGSPSGPEVKMCAWERPCAQCAMSVHCACTLHVMELEHTITRYSATFQTCQEKVNWYLNLRLSNERPLQKAPTLSSLFKMSFFLLKKETPLKKCLGQIFPRYGRSSGNARKKLLWSARFFMRAEKICRLYCVEA